MARSFSTRAPDLSDRAGYYLLVGLISVILVLLDQRTTLLTNVRNTLNEVSSTIFIVDSETRKLIRNQYTSLQSQSALVERIQLLEKKNAELQSLSLDRDAVKTDNNQLREQLNLKKKQQTSLLLAEVRSIDYTFPRQTIIISRGAVDGVYVGQAVVADSGLVGQVNQVFSTTSRVLIITDSSHALPVLLKSNQMRVIAEGTGTDGSLVIENMPTSKKFTINQVIVTSGLGNIYPYGFPVGRVISNEIDPDTGLRRLHIAPFVDISKTQYVFLLFPLVPQKPQERGDRFAAPQIGEQRQ